MGSAIVLMLQHDGSAEPKYKNSPLRTEHMNEEITDWIVCVAAIGTAFHFKKPFLSLDICNAAWKIQFCKIEISNLTGSLKVKVTLE
jgi:hypothetical protein